MKRRFFSMVLAILLLVTLLPVSATADEPEDPVFKGSLSISEKGIEMIKDLESYIAKPTPDNTQHSIGYGCSTEYAEKYGFPTDFLTEEEAHELMLFVLEEMEKDLDRFLHRNHITVNQYQYDALMSLTYNLGRTWMHPDSGIGELLISNNYTVNELASAFVIYCHVGTGKNARVEDHLVSRRIRETKLFLYGAYDFHEAEEKFCRLTYDGNTPGRYTDVAIYQQDQPYQILFEPDPDQADGIYFAGWYTEHGKLLTPDSLVDDSQVVHAVWTDNLYEAYDYSLLQGPRYPYTPRDNPPVTKRDYSDGSGQQEENGEQEEKPEDIPEEKPDTYVEASTVFKDLNAGQWHYTYINDLFNDGIINGYEDSTFRPDNTVSCGEALKMVMLAAGYAEQTPVSDHWASGYYVTALENGIIEETDFKDTQLNVEISRGTMAKLVANALELLDLYELMPIQVYSDTDDLYSFVLYYYGITEGYEDGTFRPANSLTRAELSTIVWRMNENF